MIDKSTGILLAIASDNAQIINSYLLPSGIQKITISDTGKQLIWLLNDGTFNFASAPFDELTNTEKKWRWRAFKNIEDQNSEILLNSNNIGQLWQLAQHRFNTMEFRSSLSPDHQLNPCDFSLSIPNITALGRYDKNQAIQKLLNTTNTKRDQQTGNHNVATIFHEIFHVFQTSAATSVFEYFYLVDELQNNRRQLLRFLGLGKYFEFANEEILDSSLTIFHCAELMSDLTGIANFKKLNDSNFSKIKNLIKYFETPKDINLNTFEIIEGSAEVFGLCCGGFNAFSELDRRIAQNQQSNHQFVNQGLYLNAYQLFKNCGGKTPIAFIILSLMSLKYGSLTNYDNRTAPDIFIWGLEKIAVWEEQVQTTSIENFKTATYQLIEFMAQAIEGQFYIGTDKSVYDKPPKEDQPSVFIQSLTDIREELRNSNTIKFIVELILTPKTCIQLATRFNAQSEPIANLRRLNKLTHDFEQLLLNGPEGDFKLYCCPIHGEVKSYEAWNKCTNQESFNTKLFTEFGIKIPDYFL